MKFSVLCLSGNATAIGRASMAGTTSHTDQRWHSTSYLPCPIPGLTGSRVSRHSLNERWGAAEQQGRRHHSASAVCLPVGSCHALVYTSTPARRCYSSERPATRPARWSALVAGLRALPAASRQCLPLRGSCHDASHHQMWPQPPCAATAPPPPPLHLRCAARLKDCACCCNGMPTT